MSTLDPIKYVSLSFQLIAVSSIYVSMYIHSLIFIMYMHMVNICKLPFGTVSIKCFFKGIGFILTAWHFIKCGFGVLFCEFFCLMVSAEIDLG